MEWFHLSKSDRAHLLRPQLSGTIRSVSAAMAFKRICCRKSWGFIAFWLGTKINASLYKKAFLSFRVSIVECGWAREKFQLASIEQLLHLEKFISLNRTFEWDLRLKAATSALVRLPLISGEMLMRMTC